MPKFIVGFYRVPGVEGTVTVESPLVGHAATDYRNLFSALKKIYPNLPPGQATRVGSTIETREDEAPFINPYPGMTLRQVFTENPTADGTGAEVFRHVGTVFFDGASNDVTLRYLQDKGMVGITLTDRMTRNATRFSNQLNAGIPVEELAKLIGEVLGDFKDLKVRVKKHPVGGALPSTPPSVAAPVRSAPPAPRYMPPEHIPAPKEITTTNKTTTTTK